ncbi:hypothetical protein BHF71_07920 [Vulcanibacillus modesticaldus]|uniref:Transporter n=1 Tax=Vulcanibacillus modesticaldus TaxID=337097 RepID=A0A1D2YVE2_9BACI|nr:hypothetical protein BHF71_07920 [Vulcanibacillus modesticaldus]
MRTFNNGIKLGLTIIGTTIGAGFASGREIWEFFSSYGTKSTIGIIISMMIFAISSVFITWISYKYKTDNYYEVLEILMGKTLAKIFDGLIFLYLFSGSIVMFAGSGATFEQWDFSFLFGVGILAIAVWLVLVFGVNGLIIMNSILIPILITIIISVTFQYNLSNQYFSGEYIRSHLKVWPSSITYTALNMISLLGVLSTMGKKIRSTTEMIIGGIFAAVFLGIVALMLNIALLKVEFVQQYEIPLFSLIPSHQTFLLILVTIVLWFAIYTTVLSNIHGLVHRVQMKWNYSANKISILIIISVIPLTFIGFSTLVKVLYPIYGVLNLYLLAVLLLYPFQTSR